MDATKPVYRLDDSRAHLPLNIAASAFILFGPLAEDGLTVAMNDPVPSVIIAKRAASLLKLPDQMQDCFMKCRYPAQAVGGFSVADENAVAAWRVSLESELRNAILGKVRKVPLIVIVPSPITELLHISILWTEGSGGVAREDVLQFAHALEQVLWRDALNEDTEDAIFLQAEPLSRTRKELLRLDPLRLDDFATKIEGHSSLQLALLDTQNNELDMREYEITQDDIAWAKRLDRVMNDADAAGKSGDHADAIHYYREALRLAPGYDLSLMSIGVAYLYLGQKDRGLRFLNRASEISPSDDRIRRNLAAARSMADGSGTTVTWENMPREGRTLEAHLQQLGEAPLAGAGLDVSVTVEALAENGTLFEVPAFFRIRKRACCLLKVESAREDITDIVESIEQGGATLTATFKAFPTYPVVALLLTVPLVGDPLRSEAVPILTNADVRDALDSLLDAGAGDLYFLVGDKPRLVAMGDKPRLVAMGKLVVASREGLRQCLDAASAHYQTIDANTLDHIAAANEYFRTTPL